MGQASWRIKVKSNTGTWVDLNLPALIGSSAGADIVVHSPAVPPRAKILTEHDGQLWCWDLQREAYQEYHDLEAYGLEVRGPFAHGRGPVLNFLHALAQREKMWLDRITPFWRGAFGAHLSDRQRWSWYMLLVVGIFMTLAAAFRPSRPELQDRSRKPLHMAYGQLSKSRYGQTSSLLDFRHGITFRFNVPERARGREHAFELSLGGIDKAGEIEIVLQGKKLYSNAVRPECVDDFCQFAVHIPGEFTAVPTIDVLLVHRFPGSGYLITNVLFDQLRPLSDQERMAATRRLNRAKRLFDERAVSYQNLINAKKEIKQVLEIIRLRSGVGNMQDEAKSLDRDLDGEIAAQTEDMWFQSRRFIRLGEYMNAVQQLQALLEFYPDPGHPRYKQISQALKQLEEVL